MYTNPVYINANPYKSIKIRLALWGIAPDLAGWVEEGPMYGPSVLAPGWSRAAFSKDPRMVVVASTASPKTMSKRMGCRLCWVTR